MTHTWPSAAGPYQITPLCVFEFANALQLRVFRKQYTPEEASRVYSRLELEIARGTYSVEPLPAAVFTRARQLAQRHTAELGTRSLDVLHVAAALTLRADAIASFDDKVRQLAAAAGLPVVP